MKPTDRLIVLITAFVGLLVIYAVLKVPVVPTEMMCIDGDGYYKPADGRNYIILGDEACK